VGKKSINWDVKRGGEVITGTQRGQKKGLKWGSGDKEGKVAVFGSNRAKGGQVDGKTMWGDLLST